MTRKLVDAYYAYKVDKQSSQLLEDWDILCPALATYNLFFLGQALMVHPTNLSRLMKEVPAFSELILSNLTPYLNGFDYLKGYHCTRKSRPSFKERNIAMIGKSWLDLHRAQHLWLYLLAPIWMRCTENIDNIPEVQVKRAMQLHLSATASLDGYLLSGQSALTCLVSYQPSQKQLWMSCWLTNGGFPVWLLGLVSLHSTCNCTLINRLR